MTGRAVYGFDGGVLVDGVGGSTGVGSGTGGTGAPQYRSRSEFEKIQIDASILASTLGLL